MHAPAGTTAASHNLASPAAVAARSETDVVRAMSAVLACHRPASAAEALQVLRRGYPDVPLAMRIAALRAGGQ